MEDIKNKLFNFETRKTGQSKLKQSIKTRAVIGHRLQPPTTSESTSTLNLPSDSKIVFLCVFNRRLHPWAGADRGWTLSR